jgi:SAM-dependent methyltransferase
MKVEWDYTDLAEAYLKRPDYAPSVIDGILERAGAERGARACDIGAGTAHLTLPLLERGLVVDAVEPNDAMRRLGRWRTANIPGVTWHDGTAEATGMGSEEYVLVTFGSSFNVCDRRIALVETHRLLRQGGWFACLWNHRDLTDPLQAEVEAVIRARVPGYTLGSRREDQTEVIAASGLFEPVQVVTGRIVHTVSTVDWIEAWRSHATLARQAGAKQMEVVAAIEALLAHHNLERIDVPYTTRAWMARKAA